MASAARVWTTSACARARSASRCSGWEDGRGSAIFSAARASSCCRAMSGASCSGSSARAVFGSGWALAWSWTFWILAASSACCWASRVARVWGLRIPDSGFRIPDSRFGFGVGFGFGFGVGFGVGVGLFFWDLESGIRDLESARAWARASSFSAARARAASACAGAGMSAAQFLGARRAEAFCHLGGLGDRLTGGLRGGGGGLGRRGDGVQPGQILGHGRCSWATLAGSWGASSPVRACSAWASVAACSAGGA